LREPPQFHLGHQPALDGLRGVAILLVMAAHLGGLQETFAFLGVNIFFVLSGFLITSLLLEEWDRSQRISLKAFYARRALRLLPALTAMLLVFVIVAPQRHEFVIHQVHLALLAFFYSMNWAIMSRRAHVDFIGHTWSLSIEEQFYLLWPVILLFLLRRTNRISMFGWAMLAAVASWLTRNVLLIYHFDPSKRLYYGLDTRADALLFGCAAAIVIASGLLPRSPRTNTVMLCAALISVAGLAWIGQKCYVDGPRMLQYGWGLCSLFPALIILCLLTVPESFLGRALGNTVLAYVGKVSYGLYLWHWPILRFVQMRSWPTWKSNVVTILATVVVTLASYYLLELPCMRLKRRFQRIPVTATTS
jgi:peptidoglycan/LPS O-acetylase OafA/YrhL